MTPGDWLVALRANPQARVRATLQGQASRRLTSLALDTRASLASLDLVSELVSRDPRKPMTAREEEVLWQIATAGPHTVGV